MEPRLAVRAILLTPQDEVLLLRICNPETRERFWITPGGGIEPGESAEAALRRELHEELSLQNFEMGPLVWRRQHTYSWSGRRHCQREDYYLLAVERFEPVMIDAHEASVIDCLQWWSLTDLQQTSERLTPLSLVSIIARYRASGLPGRIPETEVLVDEVTADSV